VSDGEMAIVGSRRSNNDEATNAGEIEERTCERLKLVSIKPTNIQDSKGSGVVHGSRKAVEGRMNVIDSCVQPKHTDTEVIEETVHSDNMNADVMAMKAVKTERKGSLTIVGGSRTSDQVCADSTENKFIEEPYTSSDVLNAGNTSDQLNAVSNVGNNPIKKKHKHKHAVDDSAVHTSMVDGTAAHNPSLEGTVVHKHSVYGTAVHKHSADGTAVHMHALDGIAAPTHSVDGTAAPTYSVDGPAATVQKNEQRVDMICDSHVTDSTDHVDDVIERSNNGQVSRNISDEHPVEAKLRNLNDEEDSCSPTSHPTRCVNGFNRVSNASETLSEDKGRQYKHTNTDAMDVILDTFPEETAPTAELDCGDTTEEEFVLGQVKVTRTPDEQFSKPHVQTDYVQRRLVSVYFNMSAPTVDIHSSIGDSEKYSSITYIDDTDEPSRSDDPLSTDVLNADDSLKVKKHHSTRRPVGDIGSSVDSSDDLVGPIPNLLIQSATETDPEETDTGSESTCSCSDTEGRTTESSSNADTVKFENVPTTKLAAEGVSKAGVITAGVVTGQISSERGQERVVIDANTVGVPTGQRNSESSAKKRKVMKIIEFQRDPDDDCSRLPSFDRTKPDKYPKQKGSEPLELELCDDTCDSLNTESFVSDPVDIQDDKGTPVEDHSYNIEVFDDRVSLKESHGGGSHDSGSHGRGSPDSEAASSPQESAASSEEDSDGYAAQRQLYVINEVEPNGEDLNEEQEKEEEEEEEEEAGDVYLPCQSVSYDVLCGCVMHILHDCHLSALSIQ